jgi:hypothetical protein
MVPAQGGYIGTPTQAMLELAKLRRREDRNRRDARAGAHKAVGEAGRRGEAVGERAFPLFVGASGGGGEGLGVDGEEVVVGVGVVVGADGIGGGSGCLQGGGGTSGTRMAGAGVERDSHVSKQALALWASWRLSDCRRPGRALRADLTTLSSGLRQAGGRRSGARLGGRIPSRPDQRSCWLARNSGVVSSGSGAAAGRVTS